MKNFFKENIIYILLLIFLSLLLIFWGQVILREFNTQTYNENIITLDDRIRCIRSLGWEVDKTSETVKKSYIPDEMSEELFSYNEIQKLCGFDLTDYLGSAVEVYTYRILNLTKSIDSDAFLNIIIYKNKIIGGDCKITELDGVVLPVKYRTD